MDRLLKKDWIFVIEKIFQPLREQSEWKPNGAQVMNMGKKHECALAENVGQAFNNTGHS